MDANWRIYSAPKDEIPPEDEARLSGYLKGREEAALLAEAKIREIEARMREEEAND